MGYTKDTILKKCDAAMENIHLFYTEDFVNYRGRCVDTDELYSEVIAQYICEHIDSFVERINPITREMSYKTEGHLGEYNPSSQREEEVIAMKMFRFCKDGGQYDYIGKIIDYQTPLKNKCCDKAGKIDLIAYDGSQLRLLELKKPSSDETMLRCVMEGFTYLSTVNKRKLLLDFGLPEDTRIIACPFVFVGEDSNPYREMQEDRPQLKRLMAMLNSRAYYIIQEGGMFTITEG